MDKVNKDQINFNVVFGGCDHGGLEVKDYLLNVLDVYTDMVIVDYGAFSNVEVVDFPDYVDVVANSIKGQHDLGLLCCSTGTGMTIAANRYKNINAALCFDARMAYFARAHNNCNVFICSAEMLREKDILNDILFTFLSTKFFGAERYIRRLKVISKWPVI